ncbi:MAG: S8 family peptidase [Bdellovibrionia bacterium]
MSQKENRSIKRTRLSPFFSLAVGGFFVSSLSSLAEDFDPNRIQNWALYNKNYPSHIHAPEAWKIQQGNSSVVVAVVDTGIYPWDPSLAPNLWKNKNSPGEKEYGWDFVTNKPNPVDTHGHGTHIAGIIGALFNPEAGTSGVTHRVSIMAVKYYSDQNTEAENLRASIRAMRYAIEHGAKIINYSGGGPSFSNEEFEVLKEAEKKGVLLVAAAGNEHSNADDENFSFYPACYPLSNIISVASTDIQNHLLSSSNWGKNKIHVAAPGDKILSQIPGNKRALLTGTSQATAFVSGIAALLLSQNPLLTPQAIKKIILSSSDGLPELKNKVSSGGRVNAYAALLGTLKLR